MKSPEGRKLRPTSDRIREAIFDLLGPDTAGRNVLDLFAGTGALGIEALSRGWHTAVFVDNDRAAQNLIRENLARCETEHLARVEPKDVLEFLDRFDAAAPFDLVLIDPPYRQGLIEQVVDKLTCISGVSAGGYVVCEGERDLKLPAEMGHLNRIKSRKYGDSSVHIYRCTLVDKESPDG